MLSDILQHSRIIWKILIYIYEFSTIFQNSLESAIIFNIMDFKAMIHLPDS